MNDKMELISAGSNLAEEVPCMDEIEAYIQAAVEAKVATVEARIAKLEERQTVLEQAQTLIIEQQMELRQRLEMLEQRQQELSDDFWGMDDLWPQQQAEPVLQQDRITAIETVGASPARVRIVVKREHKLP